VSASVSDRGKSRVGHGLRQRGSGAYLRLTEQVAVDVEDFEFKVLDDRLQHLFRQAHEGPDEPDPGRTYRWSGAVPRSGYWADASNAAPIVYHVVYQRDECEGAATHLEGARAAAMLFHPSSSTGFMYASRLSALLNKERGSDSSKEVVLATAVVRHLKLSLNSDSSPVLSPMDQIRIFVAFPAQRSDGMDAQLGEVHTIQQQNSCTDKN
jgi:hypothetical protein